MRNTQFHIEFLRLLDVLEPRLEEVVIIGGWAHEPYRLHERRTEVDYPPLSTIDADVVMKPTAFRGIDLSKRLLEAGFIEEFRGEASPPATHYHLTHEASGFYAEFLAPLTGSPVSRDGQSRATASIAGVTVQQLRYLELLLHAPWNVRVGSHVEAGKSYRVQIPKPVAFIVQKLLILERRQSQDQAKDLLYIHDTLDLFSGHLTELRTDWKTTYEPMLPRKTARRVGFIASGQLSTITKLLQDAARIAVDANRGVDAASIQLGCLVGFQALGLIAQKEARSP